MRICTHLVNLKRKKRFNRNLVSVRTVLTLKGPGLGPLGLRSRVELGRLGRPRARDLRLALRVASLAASPATAQPGIKVVKSSRCCAGVS